MKPVVFDNPNYEKPTDQRQVEGRLNRTPRSKASALWAERIKQAYLAGFNASGEGYNGEYPFRDNDHEPDADADWCAGRDQAINDILKSKG